MPMGDEILVASRRGGGLMIKNFSLSTQKQASNAKCVVDTRAMYCESTRLTMLSTSTCTPSVLVSED